MDLKDAQRQLLSIPLEHLAVQTTGLVEFNVTEDTQASLDVMHQINDFFESISQPNDKVTELTMFHDQQFTNLCHSFCTMSSFRHVLIEFILTDEACRHHTWKRTVHRMKNVVSSQTETKTTKLCKEIDGKGDYSFNQMLVGFLACVNPRSLVGDSTKQLASIETVIARLVYRTALEVEGWKRLRPIRQIFQKLKIDIDDLQLCYEKVQHPNSACITNILEIYMGKGNSWFNQGNPFEVNSLSYHQ